MISCPFSVCTFIRSLNLNVIFLSGDLADFISIHRYFENKGDDDDFLASFYDMEQFIKTSCATCDYVKALKRSKKEMMLSFDEWNIWYQSKLEPHPWMTEPRILEDHYSLLDALAFSGMAITLLNHADRVKVACLAQLVNVIAPVFTEPGKGAYKQSIYFPFRDVSLYGRGTVLTPIVRTENKLTQAYGEVPAVIFSTIYNEENEEVTVFALNTNKNESSETQIDLSSFGKTQMIMRTELSGKDLGAKNSLENPDAIKTVEISPVQSDNNIYDVNLNAASWNVLRFKICK